MARHKDADINLPPTSAANMRSWEAIQTGILMDIRDELKQLNQTLGCFRLVRMAEDINRIEKRVAKHMPLQSGRPRKNP